MIAKQMVKADAAIVDALRKQQPLPDDKLDALAVFTRAVVKQRGVVGGQALDDFIAAGYKLRSGFGSCAGRDDENAQ